VWLDVDNLPAQQMLIPGGYTTGTIGWLDSSTCARSRPDRARDCRCSVDFEADLRDPDTLSIWLRYALPDPRTGGRKPAPPQEVGIAWLEGGVLVCWLTPSVQKALPRPFWFQVCRPGPCLLKQQRLDDRRPLHASLVRRRASVLGLAERSAARLAHQSGGLGVPGSNPGAPTNKNQ
jgi:hypothetical protein